jgi:hypothetical protein
MLEDCDARTLAPVRKAFLKCGRMYISEFKKKNRSRRTGRDNNQTVTVTASGILEPSTPDSENNSQGFSVTRTWQGMP